MKLPWEYLHKLEVRTESGMGLGKVNGITIDTQTHQVLFYEVKPGSNIMSLFSKPLLVSFDQVITMDSEYMIVEDNVVKEKSEIKNVSTSGLSRQQAATTMSDGLQPEAE